MSTSKGRAFKKINGHGNLKLNQKVIDDICNNLRLGSFLETAVVMAGIRKQTLYNWIKLGHENPNSLYGKLLDAVERAQEEATTRDLLNIDKCAMGTEIQYMRNANGEIVYSEKGNPVVLKPGRSPDWNASAWRLERRKPKEWGKTEKVELTGKDGGPITTNELTPEQKVERQKRIDELLKQRAILRG